MDGTFDELLVFAAKQVNGRQNPQLAIDIRLIVEPHTHSDPELGVAKQ